MSEELTDKLRATLEAGISENAMNAIKKSVDKILCDIESDVMYRLKDELAPNLTAWVADLAKRTVEALLEGNEGQMRRYLGCESGRWNGRSTGDTGAWGRPREIQEWHSVIHGKLFEQGALAVRKAIVEAHRDLLVNERILDLEDQVRSLVAQVNKKEVEKRELYERLRDARTEA